MSLGWFPVFFCGWSKVCPNAFAAVFAGPCGRVGGWSVKVPHFAMESAELLAWKCGTFCREVPRFLQASSVCFTDVRRLLRRRWRVCRCRSAAFGVRWYGIGGQTVTEERRPCACPLSRNHVCQISVQTEFHLKTPLFSGGFCSFRYHLLGWIPSITGVNPYAVFGLHHVAIPPVHAWRQALNPDKDN